MSNSRYGLWVITHHNVIIQWFDTGEEAVIHYKEHQMNPEQGFLFRSARFHELKAEEKFAFFQEKLDLCKSIQPKPYTGRTFDISIKLYPEELEWLLEQAR